MAVDWGDARLEDFVYYGTRNITLSKPGFQTLTVEQPQRTPWYQIFPFEFFSDNFALTHLTAATSSITGWSRRAPNPKTPELSSNAAETSARCRSCLNKRLESCLGQAMAAGPKSR